MPGCQEGVLCILGNPLLDISASTGQDFLKKYGLKPNSAILATDEHLPMYKELEQDYKAEYFPGGSALNTATIAQYILEKRFVVSYLGAVGDDPYSKILQDKATEAGVNVRFQKHENVATGTCAVVITEEGKCRSLCANLAAANLFSKDHLDSPENKSLIKKAKYFYISGFFLTVSPNSIMHIANHANENNKLLFMNLSAEFITTVFKDPMMEVFPYVDYLFGNDAEAKSFASANDIKETSVQEIARKMATLSYKKSGQRTVVITQGPDPVILVQDGTVKEFPVEVLSNDAIVDTNGAGDAFLGGFLSQFVSNKPTETCIRCGIWAATKVIQQSGCVMPPGSVFKS